MSILRFAFVLENANFFKQIPTGLYLSGLYFDAITLALLCLPLLIFIVPLGLKINALFRKNIYRAQQWYLACISMFVLLLNSWDIAYFAYTQKRSSAPVLWHLLTGSETRALAGPFILEFWWLLPLLVVLGLRLWHLLRYAKPMTDSLSKMKFWSYLTMSIVITILVARGGLQLRPIGVIDATAWSSLEQAPIVLNTPFTVLKTADEDQIKHKTFFDPTQLAKLLPEPKVQLPQALPNKTNVVFIILESFGSNYAGLTSPKSYTPFLDSLLDKSLYFPMAIANGRTSMDAVPAILAGMPSWLPNSYILSPYCSNKLSSIPQVLKDEGYSTSFYHGAKEGSMGFKSFTKAIGVSEYQGLDSYPNKNHSDGHWGIWDHQMFKYFGQQLAKEQQPFMSAIFSLTSHHPYAIPDNFKHKVQKGPEPLCKTISYTDLALRQFFERFAKTSWFENTLFVITADHVGPSRAQKFQTLDWRYRIPIAFYHPKIKLPLPRRGVVFQQIDIMPTLFDLLGIPHKGFQLGNSCYDQTQRAKMVYDNGNLISFIYDGTNLVPIAWSPEINRNYTAAQRQVSQQIKALYQYYTNGLVNNQCMN